ncbi:MAG: HlyC/CorC family transporter [candidate division Zixibacteria bacterium]|nr:HlyC/CorC family transporter [candidate division Zixibacteria bacterium]
MLIGLYLLLMVILFYLGYSFSRHTLAVYLEPDEIKNLSRPVGSFYQNCLAEMHNDPRNILQLTVVFKSFILILAAFFASLAGIQVAVRFAADPTLAVFVGIVIAWLMYLLFLEYLPRRRALREVDDRTLRFLPILALVYFVFKPAIVLYNRVFVRDVKNALSEDQKEDIIERAIESLAEQVGAGERIMEEDEKEMIGQIFQLDITEVREVMVPRIGMVGINKNATLEEIRALTKGAGFSRYPVYDDSPDKIIGVLYVKDLFTDLKAQQTTFSVAEFMREPYFVPESKIISDLLSDFKANKIHIAIVIDEYGGTSGLVTLEDILEEIVGDIQDEYDYEKAPIMKLSDNSLQVDAGIPLEELLDELHLEYDMDDFETVGGLIYDLVGSVPSVGTKVKWNEILFEVTEVEGQRINLVKVWVKKGTD